jgi:succinate-acetate transporter protein
MHISACEELSDFCVSFLCSWSIFQIVCFAITNKLMKYYMFVFLSVSNYMFVFLSVRKNK